MPTPDDNKVLVQKFWLGVFNDRNLSLVDTMLSDKYTFNGYPNSKAAVKKFAQGLWAQWPDIKFTIIDMVAEGDMVALRYSVSGTTPKGFKQTGMTANFVTVQGGLGVSNWQAGGEMLPPDPSAPPSK